MAKKSEKKPTETSPLAAAAAPAASVLKNEKAIPAKAAKKVSKGAASPKRAATTPRAAKKKSAGAAVSKANTSAPSDDAVRLRAYFIAEWRHRESVPGNSDSDWIEACRQLRQEAGLQDS